MSTEMSSHFVHLLQVSKKISLKSDFIHFFHGLLHVSHLLNGAGHMTKMAAMPIYGKNLKQNLLLQNLKVDDLETWYAALGARVLSQDCSNDDPGLTLTYFTAKSSLVPYAFVWENVKQWIFQKLLLSVITKLIVGRCS